MLAQPNTKITVYIEAPGKSRSVRSLFIEAGFTDIDVVATRGRLFDLPEDEMGFSNQDFSAFKRIPINSELVHRIGKIGVEGYAIILTDDDVEGEIIARDLQGIIRCPNIIRMRLHGLTLSSLKTALSRNDEIDTTVVSGGLSRRVYDRYLGYSLYTAATDHQDQQSSGNVGRVITPILSAVQQASSHRVGHVNHECKGDHGILWNIHIPLQRDEIHHGEALLDEIASMKAPSIIPIESEINEDESSALDCGSAVLLLANTLQQPVRTIVDSMQSLYEEAKLSYPRTDSFYLSKDTARQMAALAEHFGVSGFDEEYLRNKANLFKQVVRSQGAHEAILPLALSCPPDIDLRSMDIDDQILTLLFRYNVKCGQKKRRIEKITGRLESSRINDKWFELIHRFNISPEISSERAFIEGKLKMVNTNNHIKPMGIPSYTSSINNSTFKCIPNDQYILELMLHHGLGRPSTLATHISKISTRYMSAPGKLNDLGQRSLSHAANLAPGLIDIEIAKRIEDYLHFDDADFHSKVVTSLIKTGVSPEMLSDNDGKLLAANKIMYGYAENKNNW